MKHKSIDFQKYYDTLHLQPDAQWQDVRRAFKSMAQANHPDRFEELNEKEKAKQVFFEINDAYQKLTSYYKTYGELPKKRMNIESITHKNTFSFSAKSNDNLEQTFFSIQQPKMKPPPMWQNNAFLGLIIFSLIFALTLFIWYLFAFNHADHQIVSIRNIKEIREESAEIDRLNSQKDSNISTYYEHQQSVIEDEAVIKALNSSNSFTFGDTADQVLRVQGAPSEIAGSVWHYGGSTVFF